MHINMEFHPSSKNHLFTTVRKIQISDLLVSCQLLEGCILHVQMQTLSSEAKDYTPKSCRFQQAELYLGLCNVDIYFTVSTSLGIAIASHSVREQYLFLH